MSDENSRRGLASTDEETREKVAKAGGDRQEHRTKKEWLSETGRKGGEKVAEEKGP